MDRTELLQDIQSYIDTFRGLGINDYQSNSSEMNFLNPYFGFSDKGNSPYDCRGVFSVSLFAADNINVHVMPRGYGGGTRDLRVADLSQRQLEGIHALVRRLHDDRLADIARTQAGPKLEELLPDISAWAARVESAARRLTGKPYEVRLTLGRRQCDGPDDYHALVIREGSRMTDQIGSVPLRQDRWGKIEFNLQKPLCGEWGCEELLPKKWQEQLHGAVEGIIGRGIYMGPWGTVTSAYIYFSPKDEPYLCVDIDTLTQCSKKLSPADADAYRKNLRSLTRLGRENFARGLAERYYRTEIEQARSLTEERGLRR